MVTYKKTIIRTGNQVAYKIIRTNNDSVVAEVTLYLHDVGVFKYMCCSDESNVKLLLIIAHSRADFAITTLEEYECTGDK